jgi:acetylornithine deacetylase/succinyl-diaminopimelate desuccinylase-like protein
VTRPAVLLLSALLSADASAATAPDWAAIEAETLRHFEALVRLDTSDPPGREIDAVDYLERVLEAENIAVERFAREAHRPNLVARLRGDGSLRPVLVMGHTDTVNVDRSKWQHGPFSATREDGWIYGRGTVDDKDNVVAALMTMLSLARLDVPLARDVIFLAESGEEGSTQVGIQFMVDEHFDSIDAEYCLAEGGGVVRQGGVVRHATVQTTEKIPRAIELTARGPAGHGSVPLEDNAIVHLSAAVAALGRWSPPIRLNDTTRAYFKRLAAISPPEDAQRYADVLHPDAATRARADAYFRRHEPRHASTLRSSMTPTVVAGGYRVNVIPSEAKATVDTRLEPSEDPEAFLEQVREVVADPSVEVAWAPRNTRPPGISRLDTDAFRAIEANVAAHYDAPTLPVMSTGATDMAFLRAKGMQCYGIGPAIDAEDGPRGFGAHSDQERILERELHRFVRFHYDVVAELARRR